MKKLATILTTEPVLVVALITAVGSLLLAFGFTVTPKQIASVISVWAAVAAIAVRALVTPTSKS